MRRWREDEHPRAADGRFGRKARAGAGVDRPQVRADRLADVQAHGQVADTARRPRRGAASAAQPEGQVAWIPVKPFPPKLLRRAGEVTKALPAHDFQWRDEIRPNGPGTRLQVPLDANDHPTPPDEWFERMDMVLEVGRDAYDHWRAQLEADPQWQTLREAAYPTRAPTESEYSSRFAQGKSPLRVLHNYERQALLQLLGDAMPMGRGGEHQVTRHSSGRSDSEQVLATAERHYPADWVNTSVDTHGGMVMAARNSGGGFLQGSTLMMIPSELVDPMLPYGGGFPSSGQSTAVHELGHRMEDSIGGLKALEWTYLCGRNLDDDDNMDPARGLIFPTGESIGVKGYPDLFENEYSGRVYTGDGTLRSQYDDPTDHNYEIFTTAMESLYGRSVFKSGKPSTDEDLDAFALGCMLTLRPPNRYGERG